MNVPTPRVISSLPDELLSLVPLYLQRSSLVSFSLVCKRFRELALPAIWNHLDLGKRDPPELGLLHRDLFAKSTFFEDFHFREISLQMLEELAEADLPDLDLESDASHDEQDKGDSLAAGDNGVQIDAADSEYCTPSPALVPELTRRQEWIDKSLTSVHSIGSVNFEICLMEGSNTEPFDDVFLPALQRSIDIISEKTAKIKLYIDVFGISEHEGVGYSRAGAKVSAILSCFPSPLLHSISLNGANLGTATGSIATPIASPHLQSLSLQSLSGSFAEWQPIALQKLLVSWGGEDGKDDLADLKAAFQLIEASVDTLEILGLQCMTALDSSILVSRPKILLSRLKTLRITDEDVQTESLFTACTDSLDMPNLQILSLETKDVASLDLGHLPSLFPALRLVKLSEVSIPATAGRVIVPGKVEQLFRVLDNADIAIRITYVCLRCDNALALANELGRIRALSPHMKSLSLSACAGAFYNLDWNETLHLPNLTELSFNITDMQAPNFEPVSADANVLPFDSPIKFFLGLLAAPRVADLQVTAFVQRSGFPVISDIREVIEAGQFPRLQKVGGMIMAHGAPATDLGMQDGQLREVCIKLGIESSSFRVVMRGGGSSNPATAEDADSLDEETSELGFDEDLLGGEHMCDGSNADESLQSVDGDDEWEDIDEEEADIGEPHGIGMLVAYMHHFATQVPAEHASCECHWSHAEQEVDEGQTKAEDRFTELDNGSISSGSSWTSAELEHS